MTIHKPITPHETQDIFDGRIFSVSVEAITLPGGGRLNVELVRHPGSVVIIAVAADETLLLVRQYRHPIGRFAWELPAGSLERGEDPERAAARECHEEIGQIPSRLEHLGAFFPTPGYCDEELHFFLATGLREPGPQDGVAHRDEDEEIETLGFDVQQLWTMIASGDITDLKTVAGLALLGQRSRLTAPAGERRAPGDAP